MSAHVDDLADQVSRIIAAGVASGDFGEVDPDRAGRAVLQATALFHHPAHADEGGDPRLPEEFDAVFELVMQGLVTRA